MGIFSKLFNKSAPSARYEMIANKGNGFYMWNGKLFQSDIVRSCIRPKAKAVGKLVAKHIRNDKDGIKVNPEPYMRFLLEEPNPYMTGQMLQEKLATQLALNSNAFALIIRNEFGYPIEIYPIPAVTVEAIYNNKSELFLKFYFHNGKQSTFPYSDIIHLRQDFNNNDVFGDSPAAALTSLMEIVNTTDQGIVKAVKNSGIIKWLLKYVVAMRPEDLKKEAKEFRDNYLSLESDTMGVAAVDNKADIKRIEPKDYVPNASVIDRTTRRIYSFFNTNSNIIQSKYDENGWNSYYEAEIEPVALQLSNEFTRKIFSRRERGFGNKILFETSNLQFASLQTKLALVYMVDRGALTPNEWRATLGLAPAEGGDEPVRRLDTAVVESHSNYSNNFIKKVMNTSSKIYAVDFDGTLCCNLYPKIGYPKQRIIEYVKNLKADGNKIILWTSREGAKLDEAVDWCKQHGLEFDGINENLQEIIDKYGSDCRKIYANQYLDDKALNVNDI